MYLSIDKENCVYASIERADGTFISCCVNPAKGTITITERSEQLDEKGKRSKSEVSNYWGRDFHQQTRSGSTTDYLKPQHATDTH